MGIGSGDGVSLGITTTLSAGAVSHLREIASRHLLIALEAGSGFRDLMGFCEEAEAALGRRVDVVFEDGLSPHIRERVLREALAL